MVFLDLYVDKEDVIRIRKSLLPRSDSNQEPSTYQLNCLGPEDGDHGRFMPFESTALALEAALAEVNPKNLFVARGLRLDEASGENRTRGHLL